jgi:hypothetical protein
MINVRALPAGHWVIIRHGGREGVASWDDPVVAHQRRINGRRLQSPPRPPDPRDVAAVEAWLDAKGPRQMVLWGAA